MYERFTESARQVMQFANHEAQRLNHEYIGTEHILLGLIKEGTGLAIEILGSMGIDLKKIPEEIMKIVQSGPEIITMGKLHQTPRAKKIIEYAMEEARSFKHDYVGSEHLLLGLLREGEGVAHAVLVYRNIGCTAPGWGPESAVDIVREKIRQATESKKPKATENKKLTNRRIYTYRFENKIPDFEIALREALEIPDDAELAFLVITTE